MKISSTALGALCAIRLAVTETSAESLNAMMKAKGKLYFGNIVDTNTLAEPNATEILKTEFGMFTPEYSMKWNFIQASQGKFTFDNSDKVVDWARKNDKQIRGHTLVWHQNIPDWVDAITDKASLTKVIENHIGKVVGRYRGRVYAWDVVNEVFNENGTFRNSVFHRVLGQDFIPLAFEAAHKADPNARLYINEYNLDFPGPKIDAMMNLIQSLQSKNVSIHGIGTQSHLTSNKTVDTVPAQLKRLASTKLDVAITELDIRLKRPVDDEKLAKQKQEYELVTRACLEINNCVGVSMWGVSDKDSWIPSTLPEFDAPLLWNKKFERKVAYKGVVGVLGGEPG
ncbi:glycosyl hydrolase family 10 protein [Ephemerocybe angulata]|uniref:Beta-xylanase n=1 Tax=Ephemerocybe angulata TaxID=980116 RepID=A0A8H6HVF9_9AGAR|nr:glycosyl hydrolase family 10 protein [Tulosesus angulatus]